MSSTVHVVTMARKAAGVGGRMARAAMARTAMQTMVLDICVEKDHPAVTARQEMATKPAVIDVQKARRMEMAPVVNVGLTATVRRTRRVPVQINHIRPVHPTISQKKKKATQNRMPPFDLSS
jgi:hypothetical protein